MTKEIYKKEEEAKKKGKKGEEMAQRIANLDKEVKRNMKRQIQGIVNSDVSGRKKIQEIKQTVGVLGMKAKSKKKLIPS